MTIGISVFGNQQLATAQGGLDSFTITTNAAALGYIGLIGRWSLLVEVLNPGLGNPWVEIAWGNLYGGGTTFNPSPPSILLVSNWQICVKWLAPGISWECDVVVYPGMSGLQGPQGLQGPPGPGLFPTLGPITVNSDVTVAVNTHYDIGSSGHTLTFPDPSTVNLQVVGIYRPPGTYNVTLATSAGSPYFRYKRAFYTPADFNYNVSTQSANHSLFIACILGGIWCWDAFEVNNPYD